METILSLSWWHDLLASHEAIAVLALTATYVVVLDRYVRRIVAHWTRQWHAAVRFFAFLILSSFGYGTLAMGLSSALHAGLSLYGGLYAAPAVAVLFAFAAVELQRRNAS